METHDDNEGVHNRNYLECSVPTAGNIGLAKKFIMVFLKDVIEKPK